MDRSIQFFDQYAQSLSVWGCPTGPGGGWGFRGLVPSLNRIATSSELHNEVLAPLAGRARGRYRFGLGSRALRASSAHRTSQRSARAARRLGRAGMAWGGVGSDPR